MLFEKGSFLRQTGQRVEGRESKSWLVAGVRTEGAGVCDQTGATPREGVTEYFAVISQRRRLLLFTSVVCVWRRHCGRCIPAAAALGALVMRLSAAS